MDNYICKVATKKELLKRWDYLIKIHQEKDKWVQFKEAALKNFDNHNTISYLGFLNDEAICEITAYINNAAFINDISNPSGLLSVDMAYLAAFRTNKEYEGKCYFSRLYRFVEDDLKKRGYKELSLGVNPKDVRNMQIYFHLGFQKYIKTINNEKMNDDSTIIFYKKKI